MGGKKMENMNINMLVKVTNNGEVVENSIPFRDWMNANSDDFDFCLLLVLTCTDLVIGKVDSVEFTVYGSGDWKVEKI